MKRESMVDPPLTDGAITADEIVGELQHVIADVDQFLANWFERVGDELDIAATPALSDEKLTKRLEAFRRERQQWEAERESEERQFREKADLLADAWLKLEAEQRGFLQTKDTLAAVQRDVASGGRADPSEETSRVENGASEPAASPPGRTLSSQRFCSPDSPRRIAPRDSAIEQFQRLRREIESNRPLSGQN